MCVSVCVWGYGVWGYGYPSGLQSTASTMSVCPSNGWLLKSSSKMRTCVELVTTAILNGNDDDGNDDDGEDDDGM